jgi:hypothetical protein
MAEKKCTKCGYLKAETEFRLCRGKPLSVCKRCQCLRKLELVKLRRATDPEWRAEQNRKFAEKAAITGLYKGRSQRRTLEQRARVNAFKRKARERKAVAEGRELQPARALTFEQQQDRLAVQNAREAWAWWLSTCPAWWDRAYWLSAGRPWRVRGIDEPSAFKLRYRHDPKYKLRMTMKRWMNKKVKGTRISRKWSDVLGWQPTELKAHIEKQFRPGMRWENYGEWHIDHITPVKAFTFSTPNDPEFRQCYALANLQPLWADENQSKGARVTRLL